MRSKTSTWFETKVRYDKTMDDGREKKVTEVFVVDALSFTEAEAKITEELPHTQVEKHSSRRSHVRHIQRFFSLMIAKMIGGIVQDLHSLPLMKRQRKKIVPTLFKEFKKAE